MQWKWRYRRKRYRSMTRRNVRHFPPASGRKTPINVCLWRHREHGNSNKRWRQRRFKPSQETGVKKIRLMAMRGRNLFHYDLRVYTEMQVLSKIVSPLLFNAYKKYKNSNSARHTVSQRHIRPSVCYGGSDNFSSGISGKLPKIATSNTIFSRTADPIAAKFCMTIKKIKSNNIFQNCVHSCSTLIN